METGGRLPDYLRLAARHPAAARPGCIAGSMSVANLILRRDHTVRESAGPTALQCGDAVLDVTQIARWAGCIGNRCTIIR